jgi:hypothetical protein
MWRSLRVVVSSAVAVAVFGGAKLPARATLPAGTNGHAGRWIVDQDGRVVIIHGVNVSSKTLPAYPSGLGFDDDDAAFLASEGFNGVRITVERYAVEPVPGQFDDAYLAHVAETVNILAGHGILSLIDFHQDEYGPVFHDNGYPALNGLPGLLGYEILNEPWPGSSYPTCIEPIVGLHLPTGFVALEDVLRFCIVDLGVNPLSDGWHDVLEESYRLFKTEFT